MEYEDKVQSIPYKSKVAYELVFLEAIKDVRKQRVENPNEGYINAIIALKTVLLPLERKKIEEYILDYSEHKDDVEKLKKEISSINDNKLKQRSYINGLKKISWYVYCKELEDLFKDEKLEDQNFSGTVDKTDLLILEYTGLFEKIIDILKEGDWLVKGSDMIIGGGGHGLDED